MNNARRKNLDKVISLLEQARELIELSKDEEQECFDNLSENLQGSEKGKKMENAISELEDAESQIGDIIDCLNNAKE